MLSKMIKQCMSYHMPVSLHCSQSCCCCHSPPFSCDLLHPPPAPPLAQPLAVITNEEKEDADHVHSVKWQRRWSQTETRQEKKCTLAVTVLGVLNSQLTLHLCALWGSGHGPSHRALILPQDSNATLGLTGCDGRTLTGPLIKWAQFN